VFTHYHTKNFKRRADELPNRYLFQFFFFVIDLINSATMTISYNLNWVTVLYKYFFLDSTTFKVKYGL